MVRKKALYARLIIACVRFRNDPNDKRLVTLDNIIEELREIEAHEQN